MVLTERRGSVMILTLNNPAQYNALAGSLMGGLREALDGAIGDAAVRARRGAIGRRKHVQRGRTDRREHARHDQSADRKNARLAEADRCGREWTRRGRWCWHCPGKTRNSAIDERTTRHPGYGMSQSRRAMTECIFGWGKQHGTMRKTKHRGFGRVAADFLLNLIAYNLIRIPKLVAA